MSGGDILHGRPGGGWVEAGFVPGSGARDIARIRARVKKAHKADPEKNDPWPDLDAIANIRRPITDDEWAARAFFATIRQRCGVALHELDVEALARTEQAAS